MSERQAFIAECVGILTLAAPKIVTYHNGTLVAFRNGDGDRVAIVLEHTLNPDQIKHQINRMFKVKAENQPSQDTLEKIKT